MKRTFLALLWLTGASFAATTIDTANKFAWGANTGWINWRDANGGSAGAVIGEYVCSGMIWSANAGWINLGSGAPANGIRYQNTDASDFGVSVLADGSLRGLAWGANIGWVNFEATGNPRIDFTSGILSGYAWGANIGWINLDDGATHYVATTSVPAGADSDGDGITDAWELEFAGNLITLTIDGDADGDGIPDVAEYAAYTDPIDPLDAALRITDFTVENGATLITLTWTSRLARRYHIESRTALDSGTWDESTLGEIAPDSDATTTRAVPELAASQRFYRIRVTRPLAP